MFQTLVRFDVHPEQTAAFVDLATQLQVLMRQNGCYKPKVFQGESGVRFYLTGEWKNEDAAARVTLEPQWQILKQKLEGLCSQPPQYDSGYTLIS